MGGVGGKGKGGGAKKLSGGGGISEMGKENIIRNILDGIGAKITPGMNTTEKNKIISEAVNDFDKGTGAMNGLKGKEGQNIRQAQQERMKEISPEIVQRARKLYL